MRKGKERIIFDNYEVDDLFNQARDYLFDEYAEERGWEEKCEIPDNEVWEEYDFLSEQEWDCFEEEFRPFIEKGTWLVCGTIGRWNGNFPGGQIIDSYNELMGLFADCDYYRFYDVNGHLHAKCSHHDGTHYFEIKRISEKGVSFYRNNYCLSDREAHARMWANNALTSLPHFAHLVYGCPKYEYESERS